MILGAIRESVKGLLPFSVYATSFWACFEAIRGRTLFPFGVIVFFAVLPNFWYKIHVFPFGKDTVDMLILSCLIGLFVTKQMTVRTRQTVLFSLYLFFVYFQVWNCSLRYDLPLPITPANAVFVDYKNYVEMLLLYFIAFHAAPDEKKQKQILTICLAFYALIIFREARSFDAPTAGFNYNSRAAGPFWIVGLGANQFAAFVIHFGAIAFALSFYIKEKKERWFLLLVSIVSLKPLFFAYSRGAYVAAIGVLFVFGVLKKRSLLVMLAVVAVAWQTLLPASVVERITMTESADGQLEDSAAERLVLWDKAMELYKSSPIIGSGLNSYGVSHIAGHWTSVHNLYLQTLAEQGIVGLIFLIVVMLSAVSTGLRLFISGRTPMEKGLGLGFFGCITAIVITNIFGDRWTYYATGALFWIFWGVADRMLRNHHVKAPAVQPQPVTNAAPSVPAVARSH